MTATPDMIDQLTADLRPVRPMRKPALRAAGWLLVALVVMTALGLLHGLRPDFAEQIHNPDWVGVIIAAFTTSVLAAIGALNASMPDRSRWWLLLPLPSLAVWVSLIGYGCLKDWVTLATTGGVDVTENIRCFGTMVFVSLPLSAVMLPLLRHAARLQPGLVTFTGGLAVAGMVSTSLSLFHEMDATIMVLIWNLGTAAVVTAVDGLLGRRMMQRAERGMQTGIWH